MSIQFKVTWIEASQVVDLTDHAIQFQMKNDKSAQSTASRRRCMQNSFCVSCAFRASILIGLTCFLGSCANTPPPADTDWLRLTNSFAKRLSAEIGKRQGVIGPENACMNRCVADYEKCMQKAGDLEQAQGICAFHYDNCMLPCPPI